MTKTKKKPRRARRIIPASAWEDAESKLHAFARKVAPVYATLRWRWEPIERVREAGVPREMWAEACKEAGDEARADART